MASKTRQEKRREQKNQERRKRLQQARRTPGPAPVEKIHVTGNDATAQKLRQMAKLGVIAYLLGADRQVLAAYLPGEGWFTDGGTISVAQALALAERPQVRFGLLKTVDLHRLPEVERVKAANAKCQE